MKKLLPIFAFLFILLLFTASYVHAQDNTCEAAQNACQDQSSKEWRSCETKVRVEFRKLSAEQDNKLYRCYDYIGVLQSNCSGKASADYDNCTGNTPVQTCANKLYAATDICNKIWSDGSEMCNTLYQQATIKQECTPKLCAQMACQNSEPTQDFPKFDPRKQAEKEIACMAIPTTAMNLGCSYKGPYSTAFCALASFFGSVAGWACIRYIQGTFP